MVKNKLKSQNRILKQDSAQMLRNQSLCFFCVYYSFNKSINMTYIYSLFYNILFQFFTILRLRKFMFKHYCYLIQQQHTIHIKINSKYLQKNFISSRCFCFAHRNFNVYSYFKLLCICSLVIKCMCLQLSNNNNSSYSTVWYLLIQWNSKFNSTKNLLFRK